MKRTLFPTIALAAVTLAASGCGFERSTSVLVPNAPSAPSAPAPGGAAPAGSVTPMVGTWVSNEVQLPSASSCGHFQYQITSQTSNSISGTFTAQCGGGLNISGQASGQLNGTSVPLSISGVASLSGIPSCAFS